MTKRKDPQNEINKTNDIATRIIQSKDDFYHFLIKNLQREIINAGMDTNDFHFEIDDETKWELEPPVPIRKKVTVTRISNGNTKIYRAGYNTKFVDEFSEDLMSGFFG